MANGRARGCKGCWVRGGLAAFFCSSSAGAGEGEELEGLDAGDGDDAVVAWLLRCGGWVGSGGAGAGAAGVERDDVEDGAGGEEGALVGLGMRGCGCETEAVGGCRQRWLPT